VHEFGVPLPLMVIARALGVRDGDLGAFKRWSDDFVVPVGNHNPPKERVADMLRSRKEFGDYFTQRIEERRRQPEDDLISDVVSARIDDEALTVPEMLGMFAQMLVAGNETTTKHIAWTVLMLCQDDALRSRVAADPSLVPQLVEESLRVESPVQGLYRTAVEDTEVAGVPIPAGSHLMLMYASGNRDPQQYPDPDVVDLDRANAKTHLAFGQGPHFCLGAALARAESRIAIETLLRRLPGLRLHPERHREEIEPSYVLHGLKELHLAFDPPAPA
jgi:cytochrome P450